MTRQLSLKVGVHAALDPRTSGGVQTNLLSFVKGVRFDPAEIEIALLTPDFLVEPWRSNCRKGLSPHTWPYKFPWHREGDVARSSASHPGQFDKIGESAAVDPEMHSRDDFLKRLGIDCIHMPYQVAFDTELPSIYEPWDLQHLHLPEFFSPNERSWRTNLYRRACERATIVVVATATTKQDLIDAFGLPPEKIAVVYRRSNFLKAPPSNERSRILSRLGVAAPFAFYPAATYAHKNHLRLIEAIALLRDERKTIIPLALTGQSTGESAQKIAELISRLKLDRQVYVLGRLAAEEVSALYAEARMLAFPSLFEGLGLPLLEAMESGVAIAASRASCLAEVAGDAAQLFDPLSVESIADSILKVWTDQSLRTTLIENGRARLEAFDWAKATIEYSAIYKSVCSRSLSSEEHRALDVARSIGR